VVVVAIVAGAISSKVRSSLSRALTVGKSAIFLERASAAMLSFPGRYIYVISKFARKSAHPTYRVDSSLLVEK
jgi:hypothetical protein